LDYLHHAGVVFYQRDLFNNDIILDQSWALEAIYTVFNRDLAWKPLQQLGGKFTRRLLESLVWSKYAVGEQELFLSMMESCGICFRHVDGRHNKRIETEYIAPDLLPEKETIAARLTERWDDSAKIVERQWDYAFLHQGLVRSIISSIGQKAGPTAVYWKYGVSLYETNTRSSAILEQSMNGDSQGSITLKTQGPSAADLLERLTKIIDKCHNQSGTGKFEESGAPRGSVLPTGDLRIEADPLCETSVKASDSASKSISDNQPPLKFDDPPSSSPQIQACVSYAWKEERSNDPARHKKVEEFCERMKAEGKEIVRDTTAINLGDRLSTFMRRIGNADLIYVFLSDAYLKSPNCMYELLTIWQSSGDAPDEFLDRIQVYVMPGTEIFSITERLKYVAYWKRQRDETKQIIDENGVDVLGPTELKNWKHIQDFAQNVSEILAHVADVLHPTNFDEFVDQA
jgi:internalin A